MTVRRARPPDNPEIGKEMHRIAGTRRRFGYRRIGVIPERKGMIMNAVRSLARPPFGRPRSGRSRLLAAIRRSTVRQAPVGQLGNRDTGRQE
jgi:hypothetical protein